MCNEQEQVHALGGSSRNFDALLVVPRVGGQRTELLSVRLNIKSLLTAKFRQGSATMLSTFGNRTHMGSPGGIEY